MEFSPFLYIPWLQICSPLYCDRLFLTHGICEGSLLIKQRIKLQFPTQSKYTLSVTLTSHLILRSEVLPIYLHGGTKRINTPCGQNAGLKNKRPTWCHLLFYFTSYVLNMFRTLIYPSSGACDYAVELSHLSFFFLVRCVLEIWCCWVWVVSVLQAEAELCFSLRPGHHSNPAAPDFQHTSNQEQYDRCGNSAT